MNTLKKIITNPYFLLLWFTGIVLCILFIDKPMALYFESVKAHPISQFAEMTTDLGRGLYYIIGFALFFLVTRFILRKIYLSYYTGYLLAASTIPGIICYIFKMLLGRARPSQLIQHDLYEFLWFQSKSYLLSFPSGHATFIMGMVVAITLLVPRLGYILIPFGLWVCLTRILVTAHYISDVMAAMLLGTVVAYYLHAYFVKRFNMAPRFSFKDAWNRR